LFHAGFFVPLRVQVVHEGMVRFFSTLSSRRRLAVCIEIMVVVVRGDSDVKKSIVVEACIRVETRSHIRDVGDRDRLSQGFAN